MTQSTLVDSPASTTTATPSRRARSSPRTALRRADYERAFDVLEDCDGSPSLPDFREQLVEALHQRFGLKHVSFFVGATFHNIFGDLAPVTEGHTARMLPEYQERWSRYDVFGTPAAMRQLVSSGVSSLSELRALGALPASANAYVRHFLQATWGMESAAAMRLELPGGHTALVGMFDTAPDRLSPQDLATLRALSRQLSAIARGLPVSRPKAALAGLSERQRQVVQLVADGLSNAQIAETLSLAEDSVKKYVSRILSATGCQSRMELALLARSRG
ncbi:response regulator transcription factor [Pseudonocardia sp. KRD-184]|uniref:Response regulator transcription factor n=1 Tax=Pseudonocardia oceani TaxID=2792013 RepID=A0ABS6UD03_9PSEU|nr:LuxR C-terminal-related transcriptional regulator [Pseudonocardia oceani]MBW0089026.1 response regulator transcription factor [Pseudonocardia oceani]MBW0098130.1 response regulator transcription factor [Pseudonocardia oceani]MBW0110685.1 response regulator transcription factor [Pseudonocardia oceani]MBW0124754.1 response regulator transcription factor [Pseudonocardia oceani]MBW0130125.1 response regulator transcription factor [Pseudonocardia oceani]